MRSAKIDEAFNDPEEQEFLCEIIEIAIGQGHETLAEHNADALDGNLSTDSFDMIARQERKIKFLEELHEYLE